MEGHMSRKCAKPTKWLCYQEPSPPPGTFHVAATLHRFKYNERAQQTNMRQQMSQVIFFQIWKTRLHTLPLGDCILGDGVGRGPI